MKFVLDNSNSKMNAEEPHLTPFLRELRASAFNLLLSFLLQI